MLPEAAADLGLPAGTPVAAALIDAHAGGLGTVGAKDGTGSVQSRMAYVFGTSACTMTTTRARTFVPGVWGPYHSAMVPGLWLNEGGQSAAGSFGAVSGSNCGGSSPGRNCSRSSGASSRSCSRK